MVDGLLMIAPAATWEVVTGSSAGKGANTAYSSPVTAGGTANAAAGKVAPVRGSGITEDGVGKALNLTEWGTLQNLRPADMVFSQRPVRTLVQDSNGRYWLESPSGNRITPSGSYDFVTMPDGRILVSRPNTNSEFSTHLGLSGGSDVKYAGSIRFGNNSGPNRGTIVNWTNNSGHYQPPASLNGNAGLPTNLFYYH